MSIIFAHVMAQGGGKELPLNVGTGPIVDGIPSQGLILDDTGAIYVTDDDPIDHYAYGLGYSVDGRLCISFSEPAYISQGVPFESKGHVCFFGTAFYGSQGMAYSGFDAFATANDPLFDLLTCYMPLLEDLSFLVGTGPATFTRSTAGTFVDQNTGLVSYAVIDEARFETEGLLTEGASQNQSRWSEELLNWDTIDANVTIVDNAVIGPDGTQNATRVTDVQLSTSRVCKQFGNNGDSDIEGRTFINSCWVKGEGADIGLDVVMLVDRNSGGDPILEQVVQTLTDQWVRIETPPTTGVVGNVLTKFEFAGASNAAVTCDSFLVWGCQTEESTFVSSYIPTPSTVAVTREGDRLSIPIENFPDAQGEWSVFQSAQSFVSADVVGTNLYINHFNSAQGIVLRTYWDQGGNDTRMTQAINGSFRGMETNIPAVDRIGCTYQLPAGESIPYVNAVTDNPFPSNAPVASQPSLSAIDIGNLSGGQNMYGHIRKLAIYSAALTQQEVNEDFARTEGVV